METVNDLYWSSPDTVAALMQRLDIARSALYTAVEPLPTGDVCAECGGVLVYRNRSARQADRATCLDCGAVRPDRREFVIELEPDAGDIHEQPAAPRNRRVYLLTGAAAAGAACAAAAVVLAWRARR